MAKATLDLRLSNRRGRTAELAMSEMSLDMANATREHDAAMFGVGGY
jgi:hypothetical protein